MMGQSCLWLAVMLVAVDAYSFPKLNCTYNVNDTECQVLIQQLTSNPKTKMIYIHIIERESENNTYESEIQNTTMQYENTSLSELGNDWNVSYQRGNQSTENKSESRRIDDQKLKNVAKQGESHKVDNQSQRQNTSGPTKMPNMTDSSKENSTTAHTNNQNTTWTFDNITNFAWVNKSSSFLLTYPDDFHPLTFGVLAGNIYEIEVNISNEEKLDFLRIVLNASYGQLCKRNFRVNWILDFINFTDTSIWMGYDYKCFSTINEEGTTITKFTSSIILITILCAVCILWFPLIFVLMDQNKAQMKGNNLELKILGDAINKASRFSLRFFKTRKQKENRNTRNDNDENTHHIDTYDQGDVPFGIQRVFISCFHSSRSKKVPMIVSYCRFVALLMTILTIAAVLLSRHMIHNISPDLRSDRSSLSYLEYNSVFGITVTSLTFTVMFCLHMNVSLKDYTFSFNVYSLFNKDKFLTHIKFSDILGTLSDSNILHNMINRLSIVFYTEFWLKVVYGPLFQTKFHTWNKLKKCILLVPSLFAILCNILFQLLWTFPILWYTFIYLFLSFQITYSFLTKIVGLKNRFAKLSMKLIGLPLFFYALGLLYRGTFSKTSVLAVIPSLVKMFCYTFFIALPQMNSSNFRLIFSCVFILSYCVQHFLTLTGLYTELLKMIFKIHEENKFKTQYVKIAEFDYVAAHVFPFRVQFFYFICKVFVTGVFFFVAAEQVFYMNYDQMDDEMEFDGIISFFFILLSPALAEFALNPSQEKKILSNKEEIRKWVQQWHNSLEPSFGSKNHSCDCSLYCESDMICDFVTCFGECMFGCCFEYTKDNHCRLCSIPISDDDNTMDISERNVPDDPPESIRHFITIKFPEYTQKFKKLFNASSIGSKESDEDTNDNEENSVQLKAIKTL